MVADADTLAARSHLDRVIVAYLMRMSQTMTPTSQLQITLHRALKLLRNHLNLHLPAHQWLPHLHRYTQSFHLPSPNLNERLRPSWQYVARKMQRPLSQIQARWADLLELQRAIVDDPEHLT